MKKIVIFLFSVFFFILAFGSVDARSGCCSHHGGVCGCGCCDGTFLSSTCAPYYSSCNVQPKINSVNTASAAISKTSKLTAVSKFFIGLPRNQQDLYNCNIVGNYNSMIYHLRGSSYIKKMTYKNKICFLTEKEAQVKKFRKSKN